jgi:riboflavin kinase/FMN adenylyltransferase
MRLHDSLAAIAPTSYPKPVLALGNFDGVHLGHQNIFRHVVSRADEIGGTPMVFTFDRHPLKILAPERAPLVLTTNAQKRSLIGALGVGVGLWIPFTQQFARQKPLDFIRDVLQGRIGVHELVVGYDFRFGHCRAGNAALLRQQAAAHGYEVTVIPPVKLGDTVVSSSTIRALLEKGKVEEAARLLGRDYALAGSVVEGFHRGAKLGFPTANLRIEHELVPRAGVYAVRVEWEGRHYPGVANVGHNPTFGNASLSVEVHLLDFEGDLYGAQLGAAFVARIRDERKFASVDELAAQIACDVQQARCIHTL